MEGFDKCCHFGGGGGWHVNRRKYPAKLEHRVKDPISTFWGVNSNFPQCSSSSGTFVHLGRLQAWRERLVLQVVVSIVDRSSCVWFLEPTRSNGAAGSEPLRVEKKCGRYAMSWYQSSQKSELFDRLSAGYADS